MRVAEADDRVAPHLRDFAGYPAHHRTDGHGVVAPAIGLTSLFSCRLEFRRKWIPLTAGGLTIVIATLLSLLVSFTLTPMVASCWMKHEEAEGHGPWARFGRWWDAQFGRASGWWALTVVTPFEEGGPQ